MVWQVLNSYCFILLRNFKRYADTMEIEIFSNLMKRRVILNKFISLLCTSLYLTENSLQSQANPITCLDIAAWFKCKIMFPSYNITFYKVLVGITHKILN